MGVKTGLRCTKYFSQNRKDEAASSMSE